MVLSNNEISVITLREYNAADAVALGRLLPHLSVRFSGEPIAENLLKTIIDSPYHDQLIARDAAGKIVGAATLSIALGIGAGRKAYLEDFVVDPSIRGAGIGGMLWEAMLAWCHDHQATSLNFTSKSSRTAAHAFYKKRGAIVRNAEIFKLEIS